jgi:lysozyme family protein
MRSDLPVELVSALQARLAAHRPFDESVPGTANAPLLRVSVDGVLGPQTTKALQVFLGTDPTGELTERDVVFLQTHLGIEPDGVWGPKTTAAFMDGLTEGV